MTVSSTSHHFLGDVLTGPLCRQRLKPLFVLELRRGHIGLRLTIILIGIPPLCHPSGHILDDLLFHVRIQGIDFFLNLDGFLNGCHDATIGFDLVQAEHPVFPVLQPL